jgi:uncharacterized membrane protein required for colicin V production
VPFAVRGLWRGFLRESLALVGLIAGAMVAASVGPTLAATLVARGWVPGGEALIVATVALFVGVYIAASIVGALAHRLASAIFLGGVDRAAGIVLGIAKGATLLGFGLILLQRFMPSVTLTQAIDASRLARPLTRFATFVFQTGRSLARAPLGEAA